MGAVLTWSLSLEFGAEICRSSPLFPHVGISCSPLKHRQQNFHSREETGIFDSCPPGIVKAQTSSAALFFLERRF
eukprot:scaffold972_cov126-Skeletonema_dohrnii-CCMP3373.AAC.6